MYIDSTSLFEILRIMGIGGGVSPPIKVQMGGYKATVDKAKGDGVILKYIHVCMYVCTWNASRIGGN